MFRNKFRRTSLFIAVMVIAVMTLTRSQFTAQASSGITSVHTDQFDCSAFAFEAQGASGGYAAVRIWVGAAGGTPLVDSYVAGHPSSYTSMGNGQTGPARVTFPLQPNGTTLTARVYRALNNVPGSWDAGNFVDTTVQCAYGISGGNITIFCTTNNQPIYTIEVLSSGVSPATGYVALRVWTNGTPLLDSYLPDAPNGGVYVPVNPLGTFQSFAINLPAQPGNVQVQARIYHALVNGFNSWDGGLFFDKFTNCQGPITATPTNTPTPTITMTFTPTPTNTATLTGFPSPTITLTGFPSPTITVTP